MKKLFSILIAVIFASSALAQIQPSEYESTYKALEKKVETLRKSYDVVLTPGEQIGLLPSTYSVEAGGNWGRSFYGLKDQTNRQKLLERIQSGKKIVFFIFDTAPKLTHPDLQAAQWNALARSFTGETTDFDEHGHGTHVSGIIGALSSQFDLGLMTEAVEAGLVKIVPIRVLNKDGAGNYTTNIFPGIDYALPVSRDLIAQGWGVIWNFSLGGSGTNAQMNERLTQAENAGVIVVAAAGNTGGEGINTPGNAPSVHASAAINSQGIRATFSTYGAEMYMSGPGVLVMSTYKGNSYSDMSGTSMGSPGVAAMLGWAWLFNSNALGRQISHFGKRIATDLDAAGWDKFTGWGYTGISAILAGDATKEPTTGNGRPAPPPPTQEPPTKAQWTAQVDLGEYRILWRPLVQVGGTFRTAKLRFTAEVPTKFYAEEISRRLREDVGKYFTNRGFLLNKDDDTVNAGAWAIHFLDMEMDKKYSFNGLNIEVQDEAGQWYRVKKSGAQNLKMRFQKTGVSTVKGDWIY